jgi:IS5 family transposase
VEKLVPWGRLIALIEPCYPKGERGRPPIGIERMLRIYLLAQWYGLADEALEDAIYDTQAMRNFIGVDLGGESVPDATTLLKFPHLLEENDLTQAIFEEIGKHLQAKKLLMKEGTIVDATIINAPSSTRNAEGKRDPQMHQTRKGHQWYFGMKAHIGADAESGLVHSLVATPANVSDVSQTKHLLHGEEKRVHADAGYVGVQKREEFEESKIDWMVAEKKGRLTSMAEGLRKDLLRGWERRKAQVRSKVEHPFLLIKISQTLKKALYSAVP